MAKRFSNLTYYWQYFDFIAVNLQKQKDMNRVKKIENRILELFRLYMSGDISKNKLISKLYKEEIKLTDDEKGLWFNFFKGDTGATTIANLNTDLSLNSLNRTYTTELIKTALEEPRDFKVYFS